MSASDAVSGRNRQFFVAAAPALLALAATLVYATGIPLPASWMSGALPRAPAGAGQPVDRGSISLEALASGTLNPVMTVEVGSQISGQVRDVLADFNAAVRAGEVIARIDPEPFEIVVDQAEAGLEIAQATMSGHVCALDRARADLESARATLAASRSQIVKARVAVADAGRDVERKRVLFAGGTGSAADRDHARTAFDAAQAQLQTAEAQELAQEATLQSAEAQVRVAEAEVETGAATVRQREGALRQARFELEKTFIRSPVNGTITSRKIEAGQTVAASLQAPTLFTIAQDLRAMQVSLSVDEADVGQIRAGQAVTFTVDAFPARRFSGKVLQVRKVPQVTQNVVTYTVIVSADNADEALLPGMTANARILVAQREDVLRIPNAALRYRPEGAAELEGSGNTARVWKLGADGRAIPILSRLGLSDGQYTEVLDGALAEGETVLVGAPTSTAAKDALAGL
jgi:HlyD family secretion protein